MSDNASVLFVDDEERIVRLLSIMFRNDYKVFIAPDATTALDIIRKNDIHVIVSDQRMPGMTGIDLLAEVRKISPTTARMLLTGYADLVSIIAAVNEGEVYRFLNKPWNQEDLKAALADGVAVATEARRSSRDFPALEQPSLASAVKLLAIDGVDRTRHATMELFTGNFSVIGASTIADAKEILSMHDVGVIITDTKVGGEDAMELLSSLRINYPRITAVLLTSVPDSQTIINLINHSGIYRFAMKPIAPNTFRLAVLAAINEHHRRCADSRLVRKVGVEHVGADGGKEILDRIKQSLGRFTAIS